MSEALDTLLDWANEYLRSHNSSGIPQTQHVLFHSVCQAVMYTLCFRARHFMEAEVSGSCFSKSSRRLNTSMTQSLAVPPQGGEAYLNSLGLQGLVASSLEPLLACQPTVVTQFSRVMQTYELLYCQPYLRYLAGCFCCPCRAPALPSAQGRGCSHLLLDCRASFTGTAMWLGPNCPPAVSKRHGTTTSFGLALRFVLIVDALAGFVEEQLEDFFPFDPMDLPVRLDAPGCCPPFRAPLYRPPQSPLHLRLTPSCSSPLHQRWRRRLGHIWPICTGRGKSVSHRAWLLRLKK